MYRTVVVFLVSYYCVMHMLQDLGMDRAQLSHAVCLLHRLDPQTELYGGVRYKDCLAETGEERKVAVTVRR